jgi:hypothetical protein
MELTRPPSRRWKAFHGVIAQMDCNPQGGSGTAPKGTDRRDPLTQELVGAPAGTFSSPLQRSGAMRCFFPPLSHRLGRSAQVCYGVERPRDRYKGGRGGTGGTRKPTGMSTSGCARSDRAPAGNPQHIASDVSTLGKPYEIFPGYIVCMGLSTGMSRQNISGLYLVGNIRNIANVTLGPLRQ